MKIANELIMKQIRYAESNYKKDCAYELKNNEMPQVDCVEDLFAYGFLRGLEIALEILESKHNKSGE